MDNNKLEEKNTFDGIIFDVDGTLWDAVPAVCQAWRDKLAEKGYDYSFSIGEMKALFGQQVDTFGDVLFSDLPVKERRALAHECCDYQIGRMRELTARENMFYVYPGVAKTLKILSQKYPLFVVTNAENGYTQLFMEFAGVEDCIKDVEHAGVPGRTKGDNIKILMERNGMKKALYVGDTAGDQKACQEAGCHFIWASYGFGGQVESDLVIHSFEDLVDLLDKIG
ncbi:MAG: HAD family hydrolase [Eubacteriales bacterium]|nr:HAD family hydrolase [Eubacteriales bacterium]